MTRRLALLALLLASPAWATDILLDASACAYRVTGSCDYEQAEPAGATRQIGRMACDLSTPAPTWTPPRTATPTPAVANTPTSTPTGTPATPTPTTGPDRGCDLRFVWPASNPASVTAVLYWYPGATGDGAGRAKWSVAIGCAGNGGEVDALTYGTAVTAEVTPVPTPSKLNITDLGTVTPAGASASALCWAALSRTAASTDDLTGAARPMLLRFTY